MLEKIRAEQMAGYVGTQFKIIDNSSPVLSLSLVRVVESVKTERSEAFSLFFQGPNEIFVPQGTRRLKHADLGEMDIFLVPVAKTNAGYEYEAVFNHIFNA
jgi:hypothetical protein